MRFFLWIWHLVLKWFRPFEWRRQTPDEVVEHRSRYITLVGLTRTDRLMLMQSFREKLNRIMAVIEKLTSQLFNVSLSSKETEFELDGLAGLISARSLKSAREFDDLVAIRGVNRLEFEPNTVRVITDPIVIVHEGRRYRLGSYAIEIVDNTAIRVRSVMPTGIKHRFDHPHIEEGVVRMPLQLRRSLMKLIIGLEYADVTQLILNLLQSYDPKNCIVRIEDNWREEAL